VVANVQPSFVTTDAKWAPERLGRESERLKYSYAWKSLIDGHVHVAGGSDAPVEDPNPFCELSLTIPRRDKSLRALHFYSRNACRHLQKLPP
jgi:predicted amidohydrolase YtcJ